MLVHMTPGEVQGLQALAMRHGGSLSINPDTGLPEAGFLKRVLPSVIGGVVGIATMNPMLGAAVGGGLGTAMSGGNLRQGIMSGIGAYGIGGLGAGFNNSHLLPSFLISIRGLPNCQATPNPSDSILNAIWRPLKRVYTCPVNSWMGYCLATA